MKKTLVVTMTILLICGIAHATDTTKFGVDSYVPVKFTDKTWSLNGYAYANGIHDEYGREYPYQPVGFLRNSNLSSHRQQLSISSQLGYRFQSIPTNYQWGIGCRIAGDHSSADRDETETVDDVLQYDGSSHGSSMSWTCSRNPSGGYTHYVSGNLFLTLNATEYLQLGSGDTHSRDGYTAIDPLDSTYNISWSNRDASRTSNQAVSSVSAQLGLGRTYDGRFAFQAISIVRELKRYGYVLRDPTVQEYKQLCDTILEYRQRHVIDSRFRRIDALRSILGLLTHQSVIDSSDPRLPYIISDVWDYYPWWGRGFGARTQAGLELSYVSTYWSEDVTRSTSDGYSISTSDSRKSQSGRAALAFELRYDRPLSYQWQVSTYALARYVLNTYWNNDYELPIGTNRGYWCHQSGFVVQYFKDSRTSAALRFHGLTNMGRYVSTTDYVRDWQFDVGGSVNFRISVPTALNVSVSRYWTSSTYFQPFDRQRHTQYQLDAGITCYVY